MMKLTDFRQEVTLAKYTSMRIGGKARYFFNARNQQEMGEALLLANDKSIPVYILAGGTNILVADRGFEGLVLKPSISFIRKEKGSVVIGTGVLMEELMRFMVKESLAGLEWSGGLPGTIGGAIWGNAGAFGGEIKNSIEKVVSLNFSSEPKIIRRKSKDCKFAYRSSIFKDINNKEIITEAVLRFVPGDGNKIEKSVREKINYRKANHPLGYPNAGSIFKNLKVKEVPKKLFDFCLAKGKIKGTSGRMMIPTAFVIESVGLLEKTIGGAQISKKHANFIINKNKASFRDIVTLIKLVKERVAAKWLVGLEEEIQYLGL